MPEPLGPTRMHIQDCCMHCASDCIAADWLFIKHRSPMSAPAVRWPHKSGQSLKLGMLALVERKIGFVMSASTDTGLCLMDGLCFLEDCCWLHPSGKDNLQKKPNIM